MVGFDLRRVSQSKKQREHQIGAFHEAGQSNYDLGAVIQNAPLNPVE